MPTTYTYEDISTQPNLVAIQNGITNSAMTDKDISGMVWDDADNELEITCVNALSGGDQTILAAIVTANKDVEFTEPISTVQLSSAETTDKFLRVVNEPREGEGLNFYSPNFCDQTTWYEGGTLVTNFEMTDSGDHTTYNTSATHLNWVDMTHGKMMLEDTLLAANPDLAVLVEVSTNSGSSWTPKTENSWGETNEDYTVNYAAGTVTFNSALGSGDLVRATFTKSPARLIWTVQPSSGQRLKLIYAELQFTTDAVMHCEVTYETWAYNPYDLPNKFKFAELKYKTLRDMMWESSGFYPVVPACGGGDRGFAHDIIVFPFNYSAYRDIKSSQGVEVRVTLGKDGAFAGEYASVTFYCLSIAE